MNNIFNSVNFYDLNFSIIEIELKNLQKQYKIVAVYLFIITDFDSLDSCNIKTGNSTNLIPKFDNN
jgi:hypothetical protein